MSKNVKNRQKYFGHFSTFFAQGNKGQQLSKSVKNIFDNFRAAPVFRPLLGGSDFSGIFWDFFCRPPKDSFWGFFAISGLEGLETPVNGGSGRKGRISGRLGPRLYPVTGLGFGSLIGRAHFLLVPALDKIGLCFWLFLPSSSSMVLDLADVSDIFYFFGLRAGKRKEASEQVVGGGGLLPKNRGRGGVIRKGGGGGDRCREDVRKEERGGVEYFFAGPKCSLSPLRSSLRWPDSRGSNRRFAQIAWFSRIVSGFPNWTPFLRIALRGAKNCES